MIKFTNNRLEKTARLINYTVSIVLCGFLILLSGKVIDDVDEWKEQPVVEHFYNKELLSEKKIAIAKHTAKIDAKVEKRKNMDRTIKIASNNYQNAKKSFDNWLETRKTVGSPREDQEVLGRANALDEYFKTQQEWEKVRTSITDSIDALVEERREIEQLVAREELRALDQQQEAIHAYDVRVFFIRLLIIFPILLIGVVFILKFRRNKYWPLYFGFVLFSFYAFFFGLVPYLPNYGGYIHYSVGIVLIVLFGIYGINRIKAFMELRKNELTVSTNERAKKVKSETAEKSLHNHCCPSCEKDFIVKDWDKTLEKNDKSKLYGKVTDFCRFCGLQLFKKCKSCNTENFAHLPFCSSCGDKLTQEE